MVTITPMVGIGWAADFSVNFESGNYLGSVSDIERDMMENNILEGDILGIYANGGLKWMANISVSVNYYLLDNKPDIISREVNIGGSIPLPLRM